MQVTQQIRSTPNGTASVKKPPCKSRWPAMPYGGPKMPATKARSTGCKRSWTGCSLADALADANRVPRLLAEQNGPSAGPGGAGPNIPQLITVEFKATSLTSLWQTMQEDQTSVAQLQQIGNDIASQQLDVLQELAGRPPAEPGPARAGP